MNDWLRQFLFTHTRVTKPDGRPLYAYKCNDKKYAELKALTKENVTLALKGRATDQVEAIFCFYAAATFCREHESGIWAWETVFKPLGIAEPDYQFIKDWVGTGLKWWGRPLIEQNGRRRFLSTIACEGGLPLQLLQKESAAINQFFRAVLESYHAQGCGGFEMAERLARQQAYRLPVSLRQDVVFHLGGELIAAVVELQGEIGNVPNPVMALDEKVPDWRNRLPLRLEEQTAEVLFNGLVKRSGELVSGLHARLRWRGKLLHTAGVWRVEKNLELPIKISADLVSQWLQQDCKLSRLRLLLTTPTGTEVIALLTLSASTGDTVYYRREWVKPEGLSLFDCAVMLPHALSLHDGQKEYPLTIQNGEPWGELPWLFAAKHSSGQPEFLSEGSAQTRDEHAWVLVPETLLIKAQDNGHCDKRGEHLALKRSVYNVTGTVDFLTTDQARYRIRCQAVDDSTANYHINGTILHEIVNQQPVYCGLPQIMNNTAHYKSQWRPVNSSSDWREGELTCGGRLWLRLQNTADGIEIFRRQIFVLPRAFRIKSVIGEGATPGSYCLYGLMGTSVTIDSGQPLSTIMEGIQIVCPLLQITSLPTVIVSLHWATGSLTLNLPYPQRGAVFQLAGDLLDYDDCIPLDRFGGLRLLLQDHQGGQGYRLEAELVSADWVDAGLPRLRFNDRLPVLDSGRYEITLLIWQERIASLLNSSRSLDAYVRLDITSAQGECLGSSRQGCESWGVKVPLP
ncbi:MAG: STY4851/ECs_5259 family protein, partial [Methylococcaceae bacterium]